MPACHFAWASTFRWRRKSPKPILKRINPPKAMIRKAADRTSERRERGLLKVGSGASTAFVFADRVDPRRPTTYTLLLVVLGVDGGLIGAGSKGFQRGDRVYLVFR